MNAPTLIGRVGMVLCLAAGFAQAAGFTLDQALHEGLKNGPDAQLVANGIDSAREVVRTAKSVAYPSISASAATAIAHQRNAMGGLLDGLVAAGLLPPSARSSDDPYYSHSLGLKVQQPLFTFGKVSTALRMASTQERATKASARARRQGIQQSVVDAWFAALLAGAQLDVAAKSSARQVQVLEYLERNFAQGTGQKAQVLQARARLIQTRRGIIAARNAALASRRSLNRIVGRPLDDSVVLDTAGLSTFEAAAAPPREELVHDALRNRPDLQSLQETRSILHDLTFIRKAAYYPTIGLQGAMGYDAASQNASNVKNLFQSGNRTWSVGVGLSWTLFDGWGAAGETGQARAAERAMDIALSNATKGVDIAADAYLHDRMAADTGLASAREGVAAAREAYQLYQQNFKDGFGELTTVLSAEDDLRSAELGLLAARVDLARAHIHLTLVQGKDLIALPELP